MTLAIAHRGASAYQRENTIAAFRAAVDFGADGIELDVHGSSDGVIVVHHDPIIDGTAIANVTYDELEETLREKGKQDIPPTLPDALMTIGPDTIVYIEVKSLHPQWDDALLRVLDGAPNPENCQVHAFDHRIVRRLLAAKPTLRGGVLSASYPIDPIRQIADASAQTLWQQGTLIDNELIRRVHANDMTVIAWTVDDVERMQRLQRLGVDGICSNVPDVARRALQ